MRMSSVMATIMAKRRHEAFQTEVQRLQASMGNLGGRCRTTVKVARALLLSSPYLWNGRSLNVKSKSVGCGVYEVWVEKA